jgi:hypothetical protein
VTYLSFGLAMTLSLVCLVAAASKVAGVRAFRGFVGTLAETGVPPGLARPAGVALVGTELAVAALLPWPATRTVGAALAVVLLAGLTTGVARAVHHGTTAACRCFGPGRQRLGPTHVRRNATLTAVALLTWATSAWSPDGPAQPAGLGLGAAAATMGALLVIEWENVAALFTPAAAGRPGPARQGR